MKNQQGMMLIEALIGMLIFSMGILAMVGMQATAIKHSVESKNRAEASNFADQIIGEMWADRANVATFANYATAGSNPCNPSGSASTNATVTGWATAVGEKLPSASATLQQISVAAGNLVTVTVCWKSPQEAGYHNYVATAQING